jgi:hypothetical protein
MNSILKSLAFLTAAVVVLDYLLPPAGGGLRLGLVVAAIVAVALVLGRRSRYARGVQSFLLISTVSLAVAAVAVEASFRLFLLRPAVPETEQEFSKHIAAFWPAPVEQESPEGILRIVGLADSFGRAGAEDNFLYVSSRALSAAGQPNEVVNLSEWGLELRDELQLFRRFGPKFEPDLVLHSFFVGNDFDLPTEDLSFFGTVPMRYTPGLRPVRPRWFLHRRWLGNCLQARRNQRGAPDGGFSDASFLAIERQRLSKWSSRNHLDKVWPRVRGYLDEIRIAAEDAGALYSIVIQPDQYQVDGKLRDRLAATDGIEEGEVEMTLPQSYLSKYCTLEAIPCLDLLTVLQERAGQDDLYLVNDTHYNLKGNAVVGQEVARFVEDAMLVHDATSP